MGNEDMIMTYALGNNRDKMFWEQDQFGFTYPKIKFKR